MLIGLRSAIGCERRSAPRTPSALQRSADWNANVNRLGEAGRGERDARDIAAIGGPHAGRLAQDGQARRHLLVADDPQDLLDHVDLARDVGAGGRRVTSNGSPVPTTVQPRRSSASRHVDASSATPPTIRTRGSRTAIVGATRGVG